jgi:hypothetical protein
MICRTLEEIDAAALADARDDPPMTREQALRLAAILAPYIARQ